MSDAMGEFELVMPMAEAIALARTYEVPEQEAPEGGWLDDDLVDVTAIDDTFQLDVRYATDDNFMGTAVYEVAAAVLQRPVAEDLARCNAELKQSGYGVVVFDGYRPYYLTVAMYLATPAPLRDEFLAKPRRGSIHNRGAAVDIGLYHLDSGELARMPSGFDEFTDRAQWDYAGGPKELRDRRDLLIAVMHDHGFRVYREEWWHFNHPDAWRYRLGNVALREVVGEVRARGSGHPG
ncbi:MAG: M15 family metallopeptidase, partial [Planctomycetota bacterium]